MTRESRTIHIDPGSELGRALSEVDAAEVVLESNGVRFRAIRIHDDPWANYDPEKVRAGLRKFAGTITPEQAERIKESIYRGRDEGTRPSEQP
jgi:hypothetical protein